MKKFVLVLAETDILEIKAESDNVEEVLDCLKSYWVQEWAEGKVFILENIPLKLTT